MQTEYEAMFPAIEKERIRQRLQACGALLCKPEFLQIRCVFDLPEGQEIPGGRLRLRHEGDRIMLALKIITGRKIEELAAASPYFSSRGKAAPTDLSEKGEHLRALTGRSQLTKNDGVGHLTKGSSRMSMKAYKYRIQANKATTKKLQWVLDCTRELYNAALGERRDAYEMHVKRHPGYYDEETRKRLTRELVVDYYAQKRDLVEIKGGRPEYQEIASHVLQDVILRVKRTYDRFFDRVKNGEKPGYPRFKGRKQYDSLTYPDHAGWKLTDPGEVNGKKRKAHLQLSKIGTVKVTMHRALESQIKTLTVKREGEHWYAIFTCEVEPVLMPLSYEDVGIDLGVTHFAALSNGEFIDHPRYLRKAEKKLARLQQVVSRKKKGSHRRARAAKQLAKHHRKIRNQRKDFHHKASRTLVNRYQAIVLEDLQTKNLIATPKPKQDEQGTYLPNGASAKAGLNKSILDAGWASFTEITIAKAASAGRTVIFVNPSRTSQTCPNCGTIRQKTLDERWHSCPCGAEMDRDTASAKVILDLGRKHLMAGTRPTRATA